MKIPEKRNRIADDLSARITGGEIPAGSRLPPEKKLAESLGVSRDTIRSVLLLLENRKLIERVSGRGTFVRDRRGASGKVVSFLLPCAEILADRIGYRTAMATRELLSGAIREAGRRQMRVETIAVSPTNRNDDIDCPALEHLDASSKVIIFSRWYAPIFDFLRDTGARTVLITAGKEDDFSDPRTPGGIHISGDAEEEMRLAAEFLRKQGGCRRICCLTGSEKMPGLASFDIVRPLPQYGRSSASSAEGDMDFRAGMRKLHAQTSFDGIFLSAPHLHRYKYDRSLNHNLGVPEYVRILFHLRSPYDALPDVPCVNYDFREIGAAAVRALCEENNPSEKYIFHPLINYLK